MGVYRGPRTLSIMPTYTCTAKCKDCGTLSNPQDRNSIDLEVMKEAIRQAKEVGFYNVVFTGGEPTLRRSDLLAAIAYAHSLGFPTRVVSNAYWATSPSTAGAFLQEMVAAGLDEINYSTGDEHVKFIPMDRIITAVVEAARLGLRVHVMVEVRGERRITKHDILEHPAIQELDLQTRDLIGTVESPWMPLDGFEVEHYPDDLACNRGNVSSRTGCDSVLQTYVLQADRRVGSCCGLGMRKTPELNVGLGVGSTFLQDAIERSEDDFLKLWIHYVGPERILAWAAERDPEIEWEDMYAHRCQACMRLYNDPRLATVIRERYKEAMAEVIATAWLDEEYMPERLNGLVKNFRS